MSDLNVWRERSVEANYRAVVKWNVERMEMKAVRFLVNMSRCKGVSRNSKGWIGPITRGTIARMCPRASTPGNT
jgi:hypothetical protein